MMNEAQQLSRTERNHSYEPKKVNASYTTVELVVL